MKIVTDETKIRQDYEISCDECQGKTAMAIEIGGPYGDPSHASHLCADCLGKALGMLSGEGKNMISFTTDSGELAG